ncbi:MAG: transcriptional repressor [Lachnospiraceae bacterium]
MLKHSKQREAIKAFLATRTDHPTADTVYMNIREEFPNISLGTVYRNLSLLASIGEITKISCGDNADHFDPNTHPHYHFLCKECGCVQDIPMEAMHSINSVANENFDGIIEGHTVFFHGICVDCQKEKINLQKALDNSESVC